MQLPTYPSMHPSINLCILNNKHLLDTYIKPDTMYWMTIQTNQCDKDDKHNMVFALEDKDLSRLDIVGHSEVS